MCALAVPRAVHGLIVITCMCLLASAADHAHSQFAARLTETSIEAHLKKKHAANRAVLVMFHVSWCKVCQRTFPEFAAAAETLHEQGSDVDFAHLDCETDTAACKQYGVKGYPTIKFFTPNGAEPRPFKGMRNQQSFVKYTERMMQPAVRKFRSRSQFEDAFKNESLAAFVALVPNEEQTPASLMTAADTWMDRHLFFSVPNLQDLLPEGISAPAGATFAVLSGKQQQWSGRDNETEAPPAATFFSGAIADVNISAWVELNRFPGVWRLSETNFFEFTHASRRTMIGAFNPANISHEQEAMLRRTAGKLKDEFVFGVVDGVSWAEELSEFNIYTRELPRVFITEDNFDVWIEDINALRMARLEQDLQQFLDGAPLLRQRHGTWSKIAFYQRAAFRFTRYAGNYASQGPVQTAAVAATAILAILLVLAVFYCIMSCFQILLADPEEDFAHYKNHRGPPGAEKKED